MIGTCTNRFCSNMSSQVFLVYHDHELKEVCDSWQTVDDYKCDQYMPLIDRALLKLDQDQLIRDIQNGLYHKTEYNGFSDSTEERNYFVQMVQEYYDNRETDKKLEILKVDRLEEIMFRLQVVGPTIRMEHKSMYCSKAGLFRMIDRRFT